MSGFFHFQAKETSYIHKFTYSAEDVSGNWKKWTLLIFIIGLCNLITGILRIAEDGLPEGKLTTINIPVMMGAMFMVIVAAVLIQKAREKRSED